MTGLRFCMLTTFYPPYNFGGDGIGVQKLARALVVRGHEVTVVQDTDAYTVLNGNAPEAVVCENDGVNVVHLSSCMKRLSVLLTQQTGRPIFQGRRLRELIGNRRFDVVNFHNVSLIGGPGLLGLSDAINIFEAHEHWLVCPSHVLWRHNREPCSQRQCLRCVLHHQRPPQLWRYFGYLEKQLRHIDVFIAKSEFSRAKHREFGFQREMEVVPYFLPDDEPSSSVVTQAERSPHDRPYFLFAGRLEVIKGLDDVIPVFARFHDADLLIAGDGDYGSQLRKLSSGINAVHFLGHLPPDQLSRYYRHALALIAPSVGFETFGITLIEAFRMGTPVVARRLGPFPEVVDACGGGVLFETTDELMAMLRMITTDPDWRQQASARARAGFERHWTESVVVPRYLQIVARAARGKGRTAVAEAALHEATACKS